VKIIVKAQNQLNSR